MITFRPWIFVVAAFLLLIAAWSSLIFVASKFAPQTVEINKPAH